MKITVDPTEVAQRLVTFYARGVKDPDLSQLLGYAGRTTQVINAILGVQLSVRSDGEEISFYVDPKREKAFYVPRS